MIHFTCDRCGHRLESDDMRYKVRLEMQAVMEPLDPDQVDDDRDYLSEVQEILERLEEGESVGADIYQRHVFDLCPTCYREYSRDPLGREKPAHFGFSNN